MMPAGPIFLENAMTESERLAMAAHLHVLLRRKVGRVTDVEWMIKSRDYAMEVLRVCRAEARHPELAEWADKLERALALPPTAVRAEGGLPPDAAAGMPARRYVLGLR